MNISNPQSVSVTKMKKIYNETQRLEQFYFEKKVVLPLWMIELRSKLAKLIQREKNISSPEQFSISDWEKTLLICESWLQKENSSPGEFLLNK